jgi:hypothetical protein
MESKGRKWVKVLMAGMGGLLAGCASYVTPGAGSAPWQAERTEEALKAYYEAEPAARYPAHIVAVRVQSSGYRNEQQASFGEGAYSVVTAREVETEAHFEELRELPLVAQVGVLNRLVLPARLELIGDLRRAAARLQADMLLVYTFDTTFRVRGKAIAPLQTITLGFLPDHQTDVTTTASAALFDVRSGYLYGLSEATTRQSRQSSLWKRRETLDQLRVETERAAFDALVGELQGLWKGVAERYGLRGKGEAGSA